MLVNIFSTVAFILVLVGLGGIKYHYSYGQKCMLCAQIAWLIVGLITTPPNYILVAQSIYLGWYTWTIDRLWTDRGYYK